MIKYIVPLLCLSAHAADWKFAVSGDSRNCGDIVMPVIASEVRASHADFYWHLGDFRATYAMDEDMAPPPQLKLAWPPPNSPLNLGEYHAAAWPDFIANQMVPFGGVPVFLTPGNHETILPATRERYLIQFADWLDTPLLRAQRLKDDPADHKLRAYYHWIRHNVDFIALDNASTDQFDAAQLAWFHAVIDRDEAASEIQSIVVGMHAALPGSFGGNHSMGDWARGRSSGQEVYEALEHASTAAHKRVYLLASHSHFYMEDVYHTDAWKNRVLPGWIVGTAGAVRYALPEGAAAGGRDARQGIYGYMTGTVGGDGGIAFHFTEITLADLLRVNHGRHPDPLIRWCYSENKQY